jgi:hypothetical protein
VNTNEWLGLNYYELEQITHNIVKDKNEVGDLLHCVIEQILKKNALDAMVERERIFYFIRVLKNNYFSKTSPYFYQYKKKGLQETIFDPEYYQNIPDESYTEEVPTIEWVYKELEHLSWFDRDLFLLWMELGTLTAVSKKTTIPLNSVGRYINQIKLNLIKKWDDKN